VAVVGVRLSDPGLTRPMTPLRARLIEEITLRNYSPRTVEAYVHAVQELARHYRRPPDRLSDPELREYLLYLHRDTGKAASTLNVAVSGLRFFYLRVLHRTTACHLEAQSASSPPSPSAGPRPQPGAQRSNPARSMSPVSSTRSSNLSPCTSGSAPLPFPEAALQREVDKGSAPWSSEEVPAAVLDAPAFLWRFFSPI
jgi:hypothetical protein